MRASDLGIGHMVEAWNIEIQPGYGDNDPSIHRTRAYDILSQTEWGYITDLREPYATEILDMVYCDIDVWGAPEASGPCMLYIRHSGDIWTRERFETWDAAITYSENHQLEHFEIYSIDP